MKKLQKEGRLNMALGNERTINLVSCYLCHVDDYPCCKVHITWNNTCFFTVVTHSSSLQIPGQLLPLCTQHCFLRGRRKLWLEVGPLACMAWILTPAHYSLAVRPLASY